MKVKIRVILLTLTYIVIVCQSNSYAFTTELNKKLENSIVLFLGSPKAYINNYETQIDMDNISVRPFKKDGRTLVPVRFICESLGADIKYNSVDSKVTITFKDKEISLVLGNSEMLVNGKAIKLDVPAQSENRRMFIPLRALVEAMGKNLFWDNSGLIVISDKNDVLIASDTDLIQEITNKFKIRGNIPGNIVNGIGLARQGGWVYLNGSEKGEFGIYKSKLDSKEKIKIASGYYKYINVVDDWIYGTSIEYTSDYQGQKCLGIYKIKADGSQKIKLCDDSGEYINVVDDWIYYANEDDYMKPYKMKTDGSNRQRINDYPMSCINVINDWIYFQNHIDDSKIYRMKTDGSQMQKLSEHGEYRTLLNVAGNWAFYNAAFYNSEGFECGLYRVKTDGTNEQKLVDGVISGIVVIDDWVYYSIFNHGIYKMKVDGSEKQTIAEGKEGGFHVIDDWIYYSMWSDTKDSLPFKSYKIKTDGSNNTEMD